METTYWDEMPLVATPLGGRARQLVFTPNLRLVNLVLSAQEEVESHNAPVEVVFLVLSGKGRVFVDQDSVEVEAGQMLRCPPEAMRRIEAGQEGLNLLVIRAPNL
ncbi:MAG TPA: cupin domain-containing protein [Syntrophomonadaceae bacterium]|nr:cupin domain-containing protein [Syntrophomonadaceae bacterium]